MSAGEAGPDVAAARSDPGRSSDSDVQGQIRAFWDEDAASYDRSPSHYPRRPQEQAAWASALRRLLPEPPATVLDAGAGTGFLSLLLASQGYQVTALDLSQGMLARLQAKAADRGLEVATVESDALHPPRGNFDAVVERHLLWTMPDPAAALAAWHEAAPAGRLVLLEGSWGGDRASGVEALRIRARAMADRARQIEHPHHADYTPEMNAALPYSGGLTPAEAVTLVQAGPWGQARIERLRDVEWAIVEGKGLLDRALGTHARWAVVAGR